MIKIIPSIAWGRRQRLGSIKDDEMIDFGLWLEQITTTVNCFLKAFVKINEKEKKYF